LVLRDRLLSLAALAAIAAAALCPSGTSNAVYYGLALLSVAVALLALGASVPVRGLAAMLACLAVAEQLPLPSVGLPWQETMLIAIAAYLALTRAVPALAPSPSWRARGRVPWGWTALVGGITPVALGLWVALMRPDLHDVVQRYVPPWPPALLVAGAFVFFPVNATLEEVIWRGVMQDRLEPVFGSGTAIALQAASFGLQHMHGVPRGPVGVVLAGSWAVMLGMLRRHTRGLLAPIIAHAVADASIAVIVLVYAR
jgi:membrane protease YdiL (CAAX protease family)